jgi:hypothetical protein
MVYVRSPPRASVAALSNWEGTPELNFPDESGGLRGKSR